VAAAASVAAFRGEEGLVGSRESVWSVLDEEGAESTDPKHRIAVQVAVGAVLLPLRASGPECADAYRSWHPPIDRSVVAQDRAIVA
jgi:hypothetical protein